MRRSLTFSTMLVVLIAVVSIAVPVSFLMRRTIHAEVHYRLEHQAEALSQHFTEEVLKGETVEHEVEADTPPGYRLTVVMTDGTRVTQGRQEPFSSEISAVVPGPDDSTLTLSTSGDPANDRTARAVLLIGLTSLLVIVAAVLLAWWQARRLAAPLAKGAATPDEMGAGDPATRASLSGLPEGDAVAGP